MIKWIKTIFLFRLIVVVARSLKSIKEGWYKESSVTEGLLRIYYFIIVILDLCCVVQ